jgi:CRP-like cAMP-binding protein
VSLAAPATREDLLALRNSELLAGLNDAELELVEATASRLELRAGERLFELGGEARELYIVSAGGVALTLPIEVGRSERDLRLDERGRGAMVGWSGLVTPHRYTLGAAAATDCVLVRLDTEALEAVFAQAPALHGRIMSNLAAVMAGRLTQYQAIVVRNVQRWLVEQPQP